MNIKKFFAGLVATVAAVTMTAVSAFAATVTLDAEYAGDWGLSAAIPTADLEAIGGDVQVDLTVETRNVGGLAKQFVIRPTAVLDSWVTLTDQLTTETEYAKPDGFIGVQENQTTVSFVISADTIATLGEAGLAFQVSAVTIKSAELSPATSTGSAFKVVEDVQIEDFCLRGILPDAAAEEDAPAEDVAETEAAPAEDVAAETEAAADDAAPAETTAPAADTTTAPATGNTTAVAIVTVMAVAGAAAIVAKKRA